MEAGPDLPEFIAKFNLYTEKWKICTNFIENTKILH